MATIGLSCGMSLPKSNAARPYDALSSSKNMSGLSLYELKTVKWAQEKRLLSVRSMKISEKDQRGQLSPSNSPVASDQSTSSMRFQSSQDPPSYGSLNSNSFRKTKIVCTIGPSTSSRQMIWKLAETGMNVARLNMSHGDHASHQKTIDLVREYNAQFQERVIAIMLDTKANEDLQLLLEHDSSEVEEIISKYSDDLSETLMHMEQQLEKLLDSVTSKCRPMTPREKQELQKMIRKLPPANLARVVEIVQHHRPDKELSPVEIFVDLDREADATLWRLYYYTQAFENAKKLAKVD